LIPEIKIIEHANTNSLVVTPEDEPFLDKNVVVNMDLIKIQVIKDGELSTRSARYVSKTLTFNYLMAPLCTKFFLPITATSISYLKGNKLVEIKDKQVSLGQAGIQDGTIINITQKGEHILIESSTKPKNTLDVGYRFNDDEENSKTEDNNVPYNSPSGGVRDTVVRQVFDDSDDGDNNLTNHSRDGSDKISTGICYNSQH